MPIENRDLPAGTRLVARYKKQEHICEVVQTDMGLRYRLRDGKEFSSPSSAGKEITGGVAVNGWRFWSVAAAEPARKERKPKAEKQPKVKAPPKKKAANKGGKAKKGAKTMRAAAKSDASYGCGVCGEAFPTMKAATKHALTHTAA